MVRICVSLGGFLLRCSNFVSDHDTVADEDEYVPLFLLGCFLTLNHRSSP